jgi:hypothetical protein
MNSLLFEIILASFEKRRKKMIGYKNTRPQASAWQLLSVECMDDDEGMNQSLLVTQHIDCM